MLRTFKEHAQVDFLFIKELGNAPILHVRDKATGYSETVELKSRDMDLVANTWINSYGPPNSYPPTENFQIHPLYQCLRKMVEDAKKGLPDVTTR